MSASRIKLYTQAAVYPSGVVIHDPASALVSCGKMINFKSPACCTDASAKAVFVWLIPQAPRMWISECVDCKSTWTHVERKRR